MNRFLRLESLLIIWTNNSDTNGIEARKTNIRKERQILNTWRDIPDKLIHRVCISEKWRSCLEIVRTEIPLYCAHCSRNIPTIINTEYWTNIFSCLRRQKERFTKIKLWKVTSELNCKRKTKKIQPTNNIGQLSVPPLYQDSIKSKRLFVKCKRIV